MAYNATTDYTGLDETRPNGASEQVSILGLAMVETRRVAKATMTLKHTSTGDHQAGVIGTTHLADGAITTAKVADAQITAVKLAAGVLTGANLPDGSVVEAKLGALSVTNAKLGLLSVANANIQDTTLTGAKVAAATITADKIGGGESGKIMIGQADGTYLKKALSGAGNLDLNGVFTLLLPFACYADIKAAGTPGGTFTSGAWQVRDLNSEEFDSNNIGVLAGNQVTLQIGSYFILAQVPAFDCGAHQAKLYDVTHSADLLFGQSTVDGSSLITGIIILSAISAINIQHKCRVTSTDTNGLGTPLNIPPTNEVYTRLVILRVA